MDTDREFLSKVLETASRTLCDTVDVALSDLTPQAFRLRRIINDERLRGVTRMSSKDLGRFNEGLEDLKRRRFLPAVEAFDPTGHPVRSGEQQKYSILPAVSIESLNEHAEN